MTERITYYNSVAIQAISNSAEEPSIAVVGSKTDKNNRHLRITVKRPVGDPRRYILDGTFEIVLDARTALALAEASTHLYDDYTETEDATND